jgi:hypothetical protein
MTVHSTIQAAAGADSAASVRSGTKRLVTGCLLALSLLGMGVPTADADAPSQSEPMVDVFDDVNPCTGLVHTVTFTTIISEHSHDGREVAHGRTTISTSSGYSGKGSFTYVNNGQTEIFRLNHMLSNDAGDRIRPHTVFVVDLSTGTARVERTDLTCVRS